jgi:amidase
MAPHDNGWHGLIVNGPLTRTVEDAALFLDVTTTLPGPEGGFVAAAARRPDRLRIAITSESPLGARARAGPAQCRAVAEASVLLQELGHQVVERTPDYAAARSGWNVTLRYLRGIHDDVATLAAPERLEPRARRIARAGGLVSDRRVASLRAGEAAIAAQVNRIFDDVDVVLTPGTATGPPDIGADRHGWLATLNAMARRSPFQAIFNLTGQPAAVVPWGLDDDGLPMAVQLVGRPDDEATLLSLSSQIEAAHPWADRRPSTS